MSDIIKIVTPQLNNKFNPIEGPCSYDLWDRLSQLDNQEKENLIAETKLILSNCISPEETAGQTTGIVIGYVQSGKTLSFTSLTALAADNKFKIIIFLAGIYTSGRFMPRDIYVQVFMPRDIYVQVFMLHFQLTPHPNLLP
jgi:hypothetical protein